MRTFFGQFFRSEIGFHFVRVLWSYSDFAYAQVFVVNYPSQSWERTFDRGVVGSKCLASSSWFRIKLLRVVGEGDYDEPYQGNITLSS